MTFNNSVLIALFSVSFSAYATNTPEPPPPFQSEAETPDINAILSSATDGWPIAKDKWDNKYQSIITGNQYINGQTLTRTWFPEQILYVENNSYSLNNTIDSFQTTFRSGSVAIGNIVKGGIANPSDPSKIYRGFMSMMDDSVAYNTIVENNGSISLNNDAKAYNTTVNTGGKMVVGTRGYAQAILIDGGYLEQSVTSTSNTKDVIVVNGGQHIIYGGTATNSHIGGGSYQMSRQQRMPLFMKAVCSVFRPVKPLILRFTDSRLSAVKKAAGPAGSGLSGTNGLVKIRLPPGL